MTEIDDLTRLREQHPGWRLLRAVHAPLIISFLGAVFVDENVRSIPAPALGSRLDDVLYELNTGRDEAIYPRTATQYLNEWAEAEWLRKYYPTGDDEAHFDATVHLERAVAWVRSLQTRSFVGTESRLKTIVDLLRQIAFGAEADPQRRLAELHRRRADLDDEIAQVEAGVIDLLDDTALRERYQQFADMSRHLLADFREVEANFRALDRTMREQIAGWSGSKGELLAEVLGDRNLIENSDQGRSFQAFHDLLLSASRQDELDDLLSQVHLLAAIAPHTDRRLKHIHHDWLDAGEQAQETVRQLSEQLRRFLDDQAWLENRRVMSILASIEQQALALRQFGTPTRPLAEIDSTAAAFTLPFERGLYRVRADDAVQSGHISAADDDDVDPDPLFAQQCVDTARLTNQLQTALAGRAQVGLRDVICAEPLEQGLAELVGYLALDLEGITRLVDDDADDLVEWHDERGHRSATLPAVTFVRTGRRHTTDER